ncbi:hypothetical protein [Candidatus Finniella inopinata]|uniref:Tail fiber protein n=1 Tax=Candidatus Finniella inopinata TaxID=1696036 RepID=A0A4Q7DJV5_9PROT|nr:hypothetical protein [Candidatus Finniella inopinata]RZI46640.1 hypothetical protein EQU50_03380 [Candidatus Finniella inopinata]
MPLPTNNSRPSLPYTPDQSLPNNQRFNLLGKRPPTAQMLDAEFNSLQDDVNMLAHGINEVEAGNIPGFDDPLNANKVLKTDGHGTLSFTLINSNQMAPNSVVEAALAPQSVTSPKIGDGAITSAKIASDSIQNRHLQANSVNTNELVDQAVTSEKLAPISVQTASIEDQAVTTDKIADRAITTAEIADRAVTTAKIANAAVSTLQLGLGAVTTNELSNLAVTNPKVALKAIRDTNIDAQGSATSTVLMATGSGNVSFNKISSASFDGSLIQDGTTLGSINGYSLGAVGGLIFCMFQIISGSDSSLQWKGFNIRRATCTMEDDFGDCLVTVTYRRRSPGHLIGFAASNIYSPTYSDTGFTYRTPHHTTASYLILAYLPEGS